MKKMIYGRIFLIIFSFFFNELKEKKAQSASIGDLPHEILEEIFDHSSIGSIENLRYVCRKLYVLSYQCFGIGPEVIDLFSFEKPKNDSPVLRYRPFHTAYQLKKMFSIFLNPSPNIKNHLKLAQIESFQFEPDSIPACFQQAMLARHPTEKDTLFQKGVHLLEQKQDHYPVAKDFLATCYRHGLGVDQNEQQAEILEDEVSSHLRTQLHQPWFPWSFQLWIEPIFTYRFEKERAFHYIPFQEAQNRLEKVIYFLKPSSLARGQHLRSYACLVFLRDWVKSDSTLEGMNLFLQGKHYQLSDKFQCCNFYLSLLTEFGLFEVPDLQRERDQSDFSKKKEKLIEPIIRWLAKALDEEIKKFFKSERISPFEIIQMLVEYLDFSFHFFKIEYPISEHPDSRSLLETIKSLEIFLSKFFNEEQEDEQNAILLQKFKIANFFEILPIRNWESDSTRSSIQNWLKSEKTHTQIQNKMLDGSFFQYKWLTYHHVAMYFITENQKLAEKTLEIAFEFSKNTFNFCQFNQIQFAQYLNRLGKFSVSHLEKDFILPNQIHGEFYKLKRCFYIECHHLVTEEIKHFLNKNSKNLTPNEADCQLRLAAQCVDSGDSQLRAMIHQKWLDLKKIQLAFKENKIRHINYYKTHYTEQFSISEIALVYFNCL